MLRRPAALVAALGLLLAGPAFAGPAGPVALGHADLAASSPGAGEVVAVSPPELRLAFNEPIEADFTSFNLLDPEGATLLTAAGDPVPGDPYSIAGPLPALGDGIYTVAWTALSAADGHSTAGFFTFGVGAVAPPPAGSSADSAGGLHAGHGAGLVLLETESRALGYLGFLLAFGLPVIGGLVLRRPPPGRAVAIALGLAAFGSGGLLLVTATTVGTDVMAYATTGRSGPLFAGRVLVGLFGAAAVLVLGRAGRPSGAAVVGSLSAIAGLMLVALGGHAAAFAAPGPVVAVLVHLAAASVWLAGVIILGWIAINPADGPAPLAVLVPRFSGLALVAIGLVGLTGLYADWVQTRNLLAFDSAYSLALGVKIVLAVAALMFGSLNYLDGGRGLAVLGGFRTRIFAETFLAILVVLATANLTSGSPPAQGRAIEIAAAPSTGQVLGPGTRLSIEPGRPGPTRFVVAVDAAGVDSASLGLVQLDGAFTTSIGLRPIADEAATPGPRPAFETEGSLLPAGSRWAATVVARDAAGTELGRTRFEFEMGEAGIVAGRATPAIDPGIVVGLALLLGALLLATVAIAGGALPRTDPATSRTASLAGAAAATVVGLAILAGGQL